MNNANLTNFENNRQKLLDLCSRSAAAFKRIDQTTFAESVKTLEDKLASEHFKIMIVGEFKRGKSTFINALLGEEVLPAYVIPCTAVINEVKWGGREKSDPPFSQSAAGQVAGDVIAPGVGAYQGV